MPASSSALRLYVTTDLSTGSEIDLSQDQARYVAQVMRRAVGDAVLLFNGRDGEWQGQVSQLGKKTATITMVQQTRPQAAGQSLTLLFAPVKRTGTDLIVQKVTELGVTVIQTVLTARTNSERVRGDRLTSIAIEAAEQCRRVSVPDIKEPISLEQVLSDWPAEHPIFVCDETGSGQPVAAAMAPFAAKNVAGAGFVIGPEGGFSETELDLMRSLPFCSLVSLGPRILRAETAAFAALTCWQALCGDWCLVSPSLQDQDETEAGTVKTKP
ncbi:MAG: 16S rRNA (uracil(1498)-N(3))-methyltransferase [Rhodospirillaceae bacterium]